MILGEKKKKEQDILIREVETIKKIDNLSEMANGFRLYGNALFYKKRIAFP